MTQDWKKDWRALAEEWLAAHEKGHPAASATFAQHILRGALAAPAAACIDDDGENRAVRCFLMLYGQHGVTAQSMKAHMVASGHPYWPDWVDEAPGHLTKGGAQLWLRLLFALEPALTAPTQVQGQEHACMWALDGAGNLYRRYSEPQCAPTESQGASTGAAPACQGANCGTTDGTHSAECFAETEAAFVKLGMGPATESGSGA